VEQCVQDSLTWRELLGKIIRDPQEKQLIANESGISPLTLTRWVSGESTPRPQNLRHLLLALPGYRKRFLELMSGEFGQSLAESLNVEEPQEIPAQFYAWILKLYVNLSPVRRFNTICDVVLQEALRQLDPDYVGMEITVVRCMPPSYKSGKVRSLCESVGCGTPPWNRGLEQRILFLGSETLAGYAVASGRPVAIQNRQDGENLFPARWIDWEESALAYPIMRADRVAGCLLISCTQPNYFHSSVQRTLIQHYAELLSIAFDADSFYELHTIKLGHMPPFEQQRSYISSFSQRITKVVNETHVSMPEAELQIWKQIEQELLNVLLHREVQDKQEEQKIEIAQS
jgi:transcriptional regulator with XRE-family HTH domain